ncbi:MAG: Gfo/Idh/MocA family oxidoreductase, partial [Opitutales bacterium]
MMDHIRWGILGTGRIAQSFAKGLSILPSAELRATGSRSQETAEAFAEKWNIPNRHASYESLAKDPEVDAIYVATPHSEHMANSILCLEAGKAVLCEKPLAVNGKQAREMTSVARKKGVLFMEGMWSRFPPGMVKVRELVNSGVLGELRSLQADFGFKAMNRDPKGRLFNRELAGGALLDIGIYPVSLSSMLFGKPDEIVTSWHKGKTGVDEQAAFIFRHTGGALSVMHSSLEAQTSQEAVIAGTKARLTFKRQCWRPHKLVLTRN